MAAVINRFQRFFFAFCKTKEENKKASMEKKEAEKEAGLIVTSGNPCWNNALPPLPLPHPLPLDH